MSASELSYALHDYDYELPEELIAQSPASERGGSRLMVVDRSSGEITSHAFGEFPEMLEPHDCLVLNDTRVIPARLRARKVVRDSDTGTGAEVEVVLLRERADGAWEALVKRGRRVRKGAKLAFADRWHAVVEEVLPSGARLLRFEGNAAWEVIEHLGQVPLPPYIKRDEPDEQDRARYQTVYAAAPGAVAAPTAGLHFTREALDTLSARDVSVTCITLHVGYGTFRPIAAEDIREHRIEPEYFSVTPETAETIASTRNAGWRIVAVGTTTCRSLETCGQRGDFEPCDGWTDLVHWSLFQFRMVDALLTNFHLPRTSLLVLVCTFGGRELILEAYTKAIAERFRFYSYGDAMLIV